MYKGARGTHKITTVLQPPPTWQASYLLGRGGPNRYCSERNKIVSGSCLLFYISCITVIILKCWQLLLISFIQLEMHMTKLFLKPAWINLASIPSPSMCWTKSKFISQGGKQPWLFSSKDMWRRFHLGVRRLPVEPYPSFYCCSKIDVFRIVIFLSNDRHCAIFPDEPLPKAASSFFINGILWNGNLCFTQACCVPDFLSAAFTLCDALKITHGADGCPFSVLGQGVWSWAFLKTSLSLPSLFWVCTRFHTFAWHLHRVDGERVHICYGKLLPQMCPENPRSRSSCSLRKPSQMPGRHCEVSVIASQALPVQLRNSCVYNALHLLGCHKSWRTEGKLWNHIFPWLICWEGKHFRGKKKKKPQRPFTLRIFHTPLYRLISWVSGFSGCRFGSHQTQHSPLWRHL